MDTLLSDLRHSVRRLRSAPGFTAIAAITLALSIGATTAIYSVVDALMLRPLPYRDPGRLVDVSSSNGAITHRNMSAEQLRQWRAQTQIFAAVEGYANRRETVTVGAEPDTILGSALTGGMMAMLGVRPQLGRGITETEAQPGRDQVIVISDALWRGRFGADPDVIGQTIKLSEMTYEVIGVMPARFNFPYGERQFWVPLALTPAPGSPPVRLTITARIRPDLGVGQAQLRAEASTIALVESKALPAGFKVKLDEPIARHLNMPVRRALYALAGAVSLVLLIACANIANLRLVQGAGRIREIAVRAALGATRGRLIRELLTETLLLAAVGGACGLLLAQWTIDLLAFYAPSDMTFLNVHEIALDTRVLLFAVVLTAATSVLFGLLPALRTSRDVPNKALQEGTRSATGAPRQERLRRAFVLVQLALSMMLLIGAGLLARSLVHITRIDPGFQPRNLISASLSLPQWKYKTRPIQQQFFEDVRARVRSLPGVVAATVTGGVPPGGGGVSFGLKFEIDGRGVVLDDPSLLMPFSEVDGDYFSVLGIPLKAGRTFSREDTPESPRAIVIGEEMARQLWKGDNPVGQRLRTSPEGRWSTVIGVVGDVYQFRPDQPRGQFAVYYANSQSRGTPGLQTLVIRTAGEPSAMIPSIKQQIWAVDPEQPIYRIESIESAYADFFATPRFQAFLMSAFALIGLAITAVGLYGVLAYAIAQRTREFGVRLALGARRGDILRLVLRSGLTLTTVGIAAGVAGSLVVTRALESLLVEIQPTDRLTYAIVVASLVLVAGVACWIPARRATQVDPVVALRTE
jgi:putative ABC transport system permease protein